VGREEIKSNFETLTQVLSSGGSFNQKMTERNMASLLIRSVRLGVQTEEHDLQEYSDMVTTSEMKTKIGQLSK